MNDFLQRLFFVRLEQINVTLQMYFVYSFGELEVVAGGQLHVVISLAVDIQQEFLPYYSLLGAIAHIHTAVLAATRNYVRKLE